MKVTLTLTKKGETICREVREVVDSEVIRRGLCGYLDWP